MDEGEGDKVVLILFLDEVNTVFRVEVRLVLVDFKDVREVVEGIDATVVLRGGLVLVKVNTDPVVLGGVIDVLVEVDGDEDCNVLAVLVIVELDVLCVVLVGETEMLVVGQFTCGSKETPGWPHRTSIKPPE